MEPATQSPLLLPANEHKQLVVIDFEYSSANTPGFEFANHFVSPTSILPLVLKRYSNLCRLSGATTTTMKAGHGPVTPASTLSQKTSIDLCRPIWPIAQISAMELLHHKQLQPCAVVMRLLSLP